MEYQKQRLAVCAELELGNALGVREAKLLGRDWIIAKPREAETLVVPFRVCSKVCSGGI